MKIQIITMVKNEEDVVEYWVNYHGTIFGYENLYIIDNYSDDGTFEKLIKYKKLGVNITRHKDYKQKGVLMTQTINKYTTYDIAIPLDIDEFICYYDKNNKFLNPNHTKKYIDTCLDIKNNTVFKCNYINTVITNNTEFGYENAILEAKYGIYSDYKEMAKTFFSLKKFNNIRIDHGNHYYTKNYVLTDLVLVHYHCRNLEQMKNKVISNVIGLGYKEDIDYLKNILMKNSQAPGGHHIKRMIRILENKFSISQWNKKIENIEKDNNYIRLDALIDYFIKLSF